MIVKLNRNNWSAKYKARPYKFRLRVRPGITVEQRASVAVKSMVDAFGKAAKSMEEFAGAMRAATITGECRMCGRVGKARNVTEQGKQVFKPFRHNHDGDVCPGSFLLIKK